MGTQRSPIRVASALYSPYANDFTLPIERQLLQVDCIFSVMNIDGLDLGWIDGIDHDDPILVPVRSMEGHRDLGTVEEYLSEEYHTSIGPELQALLRIGGQEELTPTVLVRALAIMHIDGTIDAAHAVKQSFYWGFTMLRAGALDRYTFGLGEMHQHQRAAVTQRDSHRLAIQGASHSRRTHAHYDPRFDRT